MRETDRHIFFWGSVFSNWYPVTFEYDHHSFANSEQAMMYEKAKLMGDTYSLNKILRTKNPKIVKQLGREVKPWDESLWVRNRERIMVEICYAKFSSDPFLKKTILDTGSKILVEASPYDTIWGIGMGSWEKGIDNPSNWKGLNLLGKSLMTVRGML